MRLIDADADKCRPYLYEYLTDTGMIAAQDAINAMPSIDAVQVVRCRECRYYEIYQLRKDGEDDHRYKPSVCVRGKYAEYRKPEWYCADGKRKEDAK